MANPFDVQVPNILQALTGFDQGYKSSTDMRDRAAVQAAAPLLSQGDYKNALAQMLSSGGNVNSALAVAGLGNQDRNFNFQVSQADRQQGNTDRSFGLQKDQFQQAQTNADRNYGIAKDTLEAGKVQIVGDPMTGEQKILRVGPNSVQDLTPKQQQQPQPGAGGQSSADALMQKYGGKPGDGKDWNYLATLPEAAQIKVIGLSGHNINPSTFTTRVAPGSGVSPRDALTTATSKFDNTYNQQDYPIIQQNRQRFDTGPQGNTVRSLNVVVDHAAVLRDLGTALQNGNIPLFNSIAQRWAQETGNAAPKNFDMAKMIVGTELVKALGVAGAGSEGERAELGNTISRASSPDQLVGVIDNVVRPLLGGQLRGLRNQFTSSTRQGEDKFNQMLFPSTRSFIEGGGKGESSQPAQSAIPPAAINALKANPAALRNAFEAKYGKGSADQVLGQ